ncbi:hypothetical protein ABID25_005990 [Mesorhizobium abyssinicae]
MKIAIVDLVERWKSARKTDIRHVLVRNADLKSPTAFLTGTGAAAGIALINSVGNLAGFVSLAGYLTI